MQHCRKNFINGIVDIFSLAVPFAFNARYSTPLLSVSIPFIFNLIRLDSFTRPGIFAARFAFPNNIISFLFAFYSRSFKEHARSPEVPWTWIFCGTVRIYTCLLWCRKSIRYWKSGVFIGLPFNRSKWKKRCFNNFLKTTFYFQCPSPSARDDAFDFVVRILSGTPPICLYPIYRCDRVKAKPKWNPIE